jgi:hypothetical protein
MLQTLKDTNVTIRDCIYNKRLHKLVDCIDIKVDEEILVRNVSSAEPNTKDIVENKDE